MAVQDKFVDSNLAAGKKGNPALVSGGKELSIAFNFEVAAADSDASVYRLARLPANAIPLRCDIFADASIDGTDFDLGLYKPGVGGAIVDGNLLADGLNLAAGVAVTAGSNNGLTNLGGADPIAAVGKKLWELLGLSAPDRQDYDLAITANTVGGAAGTISGIFTFILG